MFKNSDPKNWGVWADFEDFTCSDLSTDILSSDKFYKQ